LTAQCLEIHRQGNTIQPDHSAVGGHNAIITYCHCGYGIMCFQSLFSSLIWKMLQLFQILVASKTDLIQIINLIDT